LLIGLKVLTSSGFLLAMVLAGGILSDFRVLIIANEYFFSILIHLLIIGILPNRLVSIAFNLLMFKIRIDT